MTYLILALQALLVIAALVIYGSMLMTIFTHAPYVPVRNRERARFLKLAALQPGQTLIDMGSGDGRLVLSAAAMGINAIGIERQPLLVLVSRLRARRRGLAGKAVFIRGNMFKADISKADVVFCYLLPNAMEKLKEKLEREVKPGARVISNAFHIPGWTPVIEDRDGQTAPIFVYQR